MPDRELSGTTALVTGASRGFGRGIAAALRASGARVVGVARNQSMLDDLRSQLGDGFIPVVADATDPVVAGQLIDAYRPATLVLNAGAAPLSRPLHRHTWETFSRNWDVDVRHVFTWTREALLRPLDPGSVVIAFSSGAALNGSPLSGGYAGAKATIRFITPTPPPNQNAKRSVSDSPRFCRSSRRRPTWADPPSPPTPPGRGGTSPLSWKSVALRSLRSR